MNEATQPRDGEVIGWYTDAEGYVLPVVYTSPEYLSRLAQMSTTSRYRGPEKTSEELDEECTRVSQETHRL